jgi:DNA-binding NarL/FixJ family response regulator
MIRILLVDDHPVVRHGIRSILTDRLKGSIVGEASDAEEALAQVTASPWDVVVADISLPGMSGIDLIKQLHRVKPDLPTLAVGARAVCAPGHRRGRDRVSDEGQLA